MNLGPVAQGGVVRHARRWGNRTRRTRARSSWTRTRPYSCAVTGTKKDGELWRFARLRQAKFLNNIAEQDHRRPKRLVRPGLGFGGFHTARRTLAGYEAMIRKGQVRNIGGHDMRTQASFIAALFQPAA